MKHNNIAKILGWAEVPENTEGLFLQPEELAAVDTVLGQVDAAKNAVAELEIANGTIGTHESAIQTLTESNSTQAEKIVALQAEIAILGKQSSGTGTTLKVEGAVEVVDEKGTTGGKPKFDSEDHPANQFADSSKKYDSGIPAKK